MTHELRRFFYVDFAKCGPKLEQLDPTAYADIKDRLTGIAAGPRVSLCVQELASNSEGLLLHLASGRWAFAHSCEQVSFRRVERVNS